MGQRKARGRDLAGTIHTTECRGDKEERHVSSDAGDKALQVFERGITEELAKWSSDAHTNTDTDTDTDTENESFIPPHPKPEPRTTRRNNAGRRATPNPKTRTNFLGGSSRGPEIDVLGTYNMSVQADKYDGVHMDLRGNLVKAMGVLNWLSLVDLQGW